MKIAIFSDCYLDLTGGIVTTINAEKKELEARGHTVYIFSSAYPKSEKEKQTLAKEHIFPIKSCRVLGRGLTPIARRPKIIERQLEKNYPELKNFDIFYIHYEAGCSIAGIRLAKKYHVPVIQVMHGREDVGEENLIPYGFRTFVAILLNMFHSWYLPHNIKVKRDNYLADTTAKAKMWTLMVNHANAADLVTTPSKHFFKKLKHYGVTKPMIDLPHGLDDILFKDVPPTRDLALDQKLEIIWHSRLSGEKRIIPFLQALNHLNPNKYHFSVYGDGPEAKHAKSYAKKHQLNATFYGNQPHKNIIEAIKKSHLDVLTSYNFDNYPLTLVEAEISGLPVFMVDKDMTEILPDNSYVISSEPTPKSMAKALNSLIDHPEKISKMSEVMLKQRDEKKISLKINKLEKIFKELVKKSQN